MKDLTNYLRRKTASEEELQAADMIEKLREELAAEKKDAERYRWPCPQVVGMVHQREAGMTDEIKQLIEDAAKLLGLWPSPEPFEHLLNRFSPLDPERGDLMKVAMAAELCIELEFDYVVDPVGNVYGFTKGDHQSFAYAVLRAASAVLKSRGGE